MFHGIDELAERTVSAEFEAGKKAGYDLGITVYDTQLSRFQLARDLLVADVHATGLGNGKGDFLDNGPEIAVKLADRLLAALAQPQEGGE